MPILKAPPIVAETEVPHLGELQLETDAQGYLYDPRFREVLRGKSGWDESALLDIETIRSMVFAGKVAYAGFEDGIASLDLTFPQFRALMCIDSFGRGGTQLHKIAGWLGVTPRAVTGMVDALEAQGLVERVPDPTDRRAMIARPTTAGIAKARKSFEIHAAALHKVMGILTEEEKLQLRHLSLKVLTAAKEVAVERRRANG